MVGEVVTAAAVVLPLERHLADQLAKPWVDPPVRKERNCIDREEKLFMWMLFSWKTSTYSSYTSRTSH
jgi:hypothetical protein